jgi:hypothetical protein
MKGVRFMEDMNMAEQNKTKPEIEIWSTGIARIRGDLDAKTYFITLKDEAWSKEFGMEWSSDFSIQVHRSGEITIHRLPDGTREKFDERR